MMIWRQKRIRGGLRLKALIFPAHNKTEEACASSVVVIIGPPLRVDCRSALAFPTSSGSAFVLPFGCQSRALPPAVLYRRVKRLSQGTANPSRATLMARPLLVAEPGPGDALRTTRALAVSSTLLPSGGSAFGSLAFRPYPASQPSSSFQRPRPFDRWGFI